MAEDSSNNTSDTSKIRIEKILAWLNENWKNERRCPICQSNKWNINLDPGVVLVAKNKSIQFGENYPFVVINCTKCGYSFLMNEVVMGLVQPIQPQDTGIVKKEEK